MLNIYRTENQILHELEEFEDGIWIKLTAPTEEESQRVARAFNIEFDDILAALDEEESSRIDLEDGYTLILVDIPTPEIRHDKTAYTTIPLGILLTQDVI
ncbi:MAG: magnesium transporter CorA family protein, partial [Lachnospiraceae bacterium]|nr:magnesium transporter CorA family protein [Lachnospiraceae bacterium]